jgi:transposase
MLDTRFEVGYPPDREVVRVAQSRRSSLEERGLLHPRPAAVSAPLFNGTRSFFLAEDKVQVKYEMLRAHFVDGVAVSTTAVAHGYSRAAFYLVAAGFEEAGMVGLLDERRGRRGPLKLTPEVMAFITAAAASRSTEEIAEAVADRFGVQLHRRTIERAVRR